MSASRSESRSIDNHNGADSDDEGSYESGSISGSKSFTDSLRETAFFFRDQFPEIGNSSIEDRKYSVLDTILNNAEMAANEGSYKTTVNITVGDDIVDWLIDELRDRGIYVELLDNGSYINSVYLELNEYWSDRRSSSSRSNDYSLQNSLQDSQQYQDEYSDDYNSQHGDEYNGYYDDSDNHRVRSNGMTLLNLAVLGGWVYFLIYLFVINPSTTVSFTDISNYFNHNFTVEDYVPQPSPSLLPSDESDVWDFL
tara:strand:- start:760 stop:1521 length:762 start_codon:yes stop_codon:yes gene_type:complete